MNAELSTENDQTDVRGLATWTSRPAGADTRSSRTTPLGAAKSGGATRTSSTPASADASECGSAQSVRTDPRQGEVERLHEEAAATIASWSSPSGWIAQQAVVAFLEDGTEPEPWELHGPAWRVAPPSGSDQ